MTNRGRALIAGGAVTVASVAIALFLSPWSAAPRRAVGAALERLGLEPLREPPAPKRAAAPERLPALPADGWHHGGPLTADSLGGSIVVLAVFSDTHPSTYETLPRLEQWHEAYARFGVRVVGVHAPEYAFATDMKVVERLAARLGLSFPIVEDPGLQTLAALGSRGNEVLLVLAGPDGRVREVRVAGDPPLDLPLLEHGLRALLRDAHPGRNFPGGAGPGAPEPGTPSPVRTVRLGSSSVVDGPLAGAAHGRAQPFTAQFRFEVEGTPYVPYPVGWWIARPEGIEAARGGAAQFLAIRYDAPRVGVVASPPPSGHTRLWILRDEAWLPAAALGEDAKSDASGASYVDIEAPGLYFVTRGPGAHVLKLSPEDPGLTLHALTFEPDARKSGSPP
jgi:hypothetical protein